MPEISDENIQKVKEQLQNLGQSVGQTVREAIGPEKAAAISAAMPGVKSAARSAAIRSLRVMQTLCATGAEKLENGRRIEASRPAPKPAAAAEPKPQPDPKPRPEPGPQPQPEVKSVPQQEPKPRPQRPAPPPQRDEPEIIRPKSTTHARRSFAFFGIALALIAAGALVFSGITLIRIFRPRLGRPEGQRSIYEPVVRASAPGGVIRVSRPEPSAKKAAPEADKPEAPAPAALPERVKVSFGSEKGISSVNVRDDHSTRGTKVIGKVRPGMVKLLEVWDGKEQYPWYHIEAQNVTGWIYGRYIVVPPPPKPAPQAKEKNAPAAGERTGRVSRTGINVRDGHNTRNTRVLTRIGNRDVVILDEWRETGGAYPWYKIRLDDGEGWIYGRYVEVN